MNCRKVHKGLPLFVKDDLTLGRRKKVESHILRCPDCRKELDLYRSSSEKMQSWLEQESIQWDRGEWERVVKHTMVSAQNEAPSFAPWPFRKGWAYALILFIAVMVGVLVIQPSPLRRFLVTEPGTAAAVQKGYAAWTNKSEKQETISMTMVSRESGLKIVWIFDRNFEWEDIQ